MEYKTPQKIECATEPLDLDKIFAYIYALKMRREKEDQWSKPGIQMIDYDKLEEIGFCCGFDSVMGLHLTSVSEMKRAIEAGAIWYEDEHGNRV